MRPDPDTVTASEIADFVFCNESWRLSRLGHASANQPELTAGTERHAGLAAAETSAGGSIALGRALIVLGVLAALAAWLWR